MDEIRTSDKQIAKDLRQMTSSDGIKAALLLTSLPASMNPIVDNIQTQGDMSYAQIKAKLMDIRSKPSSELDKAYYKDNQQQSVDIDRLRYTSGD
ncbi:hypothetical protein HOY82DRAFT_617116 [Tuber indicum]|nr:hypothetical protein HOY82DRAFT_617116 [Tuber indicum]